MDKFNDVNNLEDLISKGDTDVIYFVNKISDMLENNEINFNGVKEKYGFPISDAKTYLAGKYATKNNRFLQKEKISRKRKLKKSADKLIFTNNEIMALKEIIANKNDVPVRNQNDIEFVLGEKDATVCLHIKKEFQEQFKEYCNNNRQFNMSEHVMLAVLEYIKKY